MQPPQRSGPTVNTMCTACPVPSCAAHLTPLPPPVPALLGTGPSTQILPVAVTSWMLKRGELLLRQAVIQC